MIRFSCPRCKVLLERPENAGGSKFACPSCGQRLEVPLLPKNQHAPGNLVRNPPPALMELPEVESTPGEETPYQLREVFGRDHVFWGCPLCQNPVDVPQALAQTTVHCPHCGRKIGVPGPVPAPTASIPVAAAVPALPTRKKALRESADRQSLQPLDDEDENLPRRRIPPSSREKMQRSAISGLTCSLVGMGLFVFSFFLGVIMVETRRGTAAEGLIHLFLLCLLGSFTLGMMGVISSSRGMAPENTKNRGSAISGLVCGILTLILTIVMGFFVTCVGVFVARVRF